MTRIILDTNVTVSALLSPDGAPAQILGAWRQGAFELVTCPEQLAELAHVLARRKLARFHIDAERVVGLVRAGAVVADDPVVDAPLTDDPDDDYLFALAIEQGCAAIVSGDARVVRARAGVAVLTPRAFVEALAEA